MAANRRIIIAMSMLLVAIFASVSVTFAWFSSGTLASAMFTLRTRDNTDLLFIKVDDERIMDKERTDDFLQSDIWLKDLTYAADGSGRWGLYHEDGSSAEKGEYILQTYTFYSSTPRKTVFFRQSESDVRSGYMARHFSGTEKTYWLREGKNNEEIAKFYGTTDINSTNDKSSTVVWRQGEPEETVYYFNSNNGAYATGAANAVRLMFFDGAQSTLPAQKSGVIWEPNSGKGYDAKDAGENYEYEQISSYYRNANMLEGNDAVDRGAASNTLSYSPIIEDTPLFNISEWRQVDHTAADYNKDVQYKCSVTLVMWIEGRDADCFNTILSDTLNADMLFELAAPIV